MRRSGALFAVAIAAFASLAGTSKASLIGQSFTATYQYPTLGSVYPDATWSPTTFVVTAGSPETVGNVEGVTSIAVDFTGTSLTLVLTTTLNTPTWGGTTFNGPVFTAAGPLGIGGATVGVGTTLAGFDLSRVGIAPNEIRIDWNGLSYRSGDTVQLDFVLVPEPASLTLLGAGLLGLVAAARPRRRANA